MKKMIVFSLVAFCSLVAGCSSKPSESNLRDGLKNWLAANHAFSTTFSDSTKMKVIECNKVDEKVFQSMNEYLRFTKADQAGMKNLGYLCGVSFDGQEGLPIFAVQGKQNGAWLAQPIFVPDFSIRSLITKTFNVSR